MKSETMYYRKPDASDIRFGYGAEHYRAFTASECEKPNGTPKAWIDADGYRWYLV